MLAKVFKILSNALAFIAIVLVILLFLGKIPFPIPSSAQSTTTPNPPVLEAINRVNKQVFIEHYNAVDVTYTEVPSGWPSLFGIKQEFVVLIRGRVPAGFDLQQLNDTDVWISSDGKRVQLTLPPPTIFEDNISIDFENSYILSQKDTCPNLFCQDDLIAYQSEVLPTGQEVLIEFALNNGILDQVVQDGIEYYEQFLKSLGYEEVQVIVRGYSS